MSTNIFAGGAESVLRSLVSYLVSKGNKITVMAIPKNKRDFKVAFDPSVKCIRSRLVQRKGLNPLSSLLHLVSRKAYRLFVLLYLKLHKYDVGIAFIEGLTTKDGVKIRANKKFAWVHCDLRVFSNLPFYKAYFASKAEEYKIMQHYDNIVCVSESAKEGVIDTVGDTGNLIIKYNPINWKEIRSKAKDSITGITKTNNPLIVGVGSLGKIKNFSLLLEACTLLKGTIPFDVWIIGSGVEETNLKEYAKNNKLENVHFLGFQQNPYCYMAQADLFVSTSISESYGLAVQEALILGVPVVAVRCSGIEEVFDNRFGKMISNSAEELSQSIRELFFNPNVLKSYKQSIEKEYPLNTLYEGRMECICDLWAD